MEEGDPGALRQRFKQAIEHIDETGRLRSFDLQLPIYTSPQYYKQPLPGYDGGAFDPERLGVACIVTPPSTGRGDAWNPCSWNLSQVRDPPLPDLPATLQHFCPFQPALFRA